MERFEHIGDWWLPEAPENTVNGKLCFDPATGGTLELYRTFELGLKQIDIIQGETDEGSVTLRGCFFSSFSARGTAMNVQYIYKGHLFDSIDDIKFESISLTYTHLDEWFAHCLFDYQTDGATFKFGDISHFPFEAFDTLLNNNTILHFDFMPIGKLLATEISFQYEARITIEPKEPLLWSNRKNDGYLRLINFHLPNFLILATGYVNYPFNVSGTMADSESPISIHYRTLSHLHNPPTVWGPSMFFTLQDVKDNLSKYLSNWIRKSDKLLLVYDLYFRSYHAKVMIVGSQFLDLAQALEGYHRRLYGGAYLNEAEYAPIYKTLTSAIPQDVGGSHRNKLDGMLKYGNEYSLRKRLKLICNDILKDYKEIVAELVGDVDSFIRTVVDTRNYLTHLPDTSGDYAIRDDDIKKMYEYIKRMRYLLRLCFLVEMGFDPDAIRRLWNRDMGYRVFIDSASE